MLLAECRSEIRKILRKTATVATGMWETGRGGGVTAGGVDDETGAGVAGVVGSDLTHSGQKAWRKANLSSSQFPVPEPPYRSSQVTVR